MTITTMNAALATASIPASETERPARPFAGGVVGGPRILLRLEGALLLAAAVLAYAQLGGGFGMFALLFFVPDVSMLGYLVGPRLGAALYNAGHSTLGPATLAGLGFLWGAPLAILIAVIWVGHIGFDRMAGYGLKYSSRFFDTHLGRVGSK